MTIATMKNRRRCRGAGLALVLLLAPCAVPAAESAVSAIEHRVASGDTLYELAETYLDDALQWPELASANELSDPRRLKPGSVVVIPAALLGKLGGATAVHVSGSVTRVRAGAAEPLQAGMRLADGDIVKTAHNGFATFEMQDGSLVRATGDSELTMQRLKYTMRKRRAETVIDLEQGRVESSVAPQAPTGSRFRIRTPLMAAGVRGTRFGVSLTSDGAMTTDVLEGRVDMLGRDAPDARASGTPPVSVADGQGTRVTRDGVTAPTPLLPSPELGAIPSVLQRPLIDLAFPEVPGARAYRAYLSRDESIEQVEANAVFPAARLRFDDVEDGDYVVVIRAIDADGIEGRPAVRSVRLKARPEPPVTIAPIQDGVLDRGQAALKWTTRSGLAGYDLQVARDAGFTDLVADRAGIDADTVVLPDLASGVYYWRIRAVRRDAAGRLDAGPYGDTRSFSVRRAAATPAPPSQQGDVMLFRWDGEPGQHYLVQIARDEGFGDVVATMRTDARQASTDGLPGGDYFLRIQATDADGYVRKFTSPQRFRVQSIVRTGDGQPLSGPSGAAVERP